MIHTINGQLYHNLIDYGIRNLVLYRDRVNGLNVFPVPDGDTGTNMILTLQNGYFAIKDKNQSLAEAAKNFASAIIFGARGNSGVITSQFFKGISESFFLLEEADCKMLASAFKKGVECAYGAVAMPVEGTLLTVIREASEYVHAKIENGEITSINDAIDHFLIKARLSLENTPNLLPVLKSAGVVDAGGAGIVYVLEGMQKYLRGEILAPAHSESTPQNVDFSAFNRSSVFEYGYCTELLVQLTDGKETFDLQLLKEQLSLLGDSIVLSVADEKVKLHVHTKLPEKVFELCHKYGEFLAVKVENMSVQHHEARQESEVEVFNEQPKGEFAVIAVAHDLSMKEYFANMGADLVIMSDNLCPPSAKEFIVAFDMASSQKILLFANGKNTYLAALQAAKLYEKAEVSVVNTQSDSECYAVLPMIDFEEEDISLVLENIRSVTANLITVTLSVATKSSNYDGKKIGVGEIFAFTGSELLSVGNSYATVACEAIDAVMEKQFKDVVTLFASSKANQSEIDKICAYVSQKYVYTELTVVQTTDEFFDMVISFE